MLNNSLCVIKQYLRRLSGRILFVVSGIWLISCASTTSSELGGDATNQGIKWSNDGTKKARRKSADLEKLDSSKISPNTADVAADKEKSPGPIEKEIGRSKQKRPIKIRSYRSGSGPLTLVVGGIHGDEYSAIELIRQFVDELNQDDSKVVSPCRVAVIPQANPDGVVLHTRTNSRGVDLNRNFDTKNWTSKQPNKKQRYKPGTSAGSESETQALMKAIKKLRPARIIVPHSPLKLINFDGPAEDLAQEMSRHTGYKVVASIGYPTPGSIGNYAGVERSIPIITLELPPNPSPQEMKKSLDALYAVVNYKKCQK